MILTIFCDINYNYSFHLRDTVGVHLVRVWRTLSLNSQPFQTFRYLNNPSGSKSRHNHAGAFPGASHMNARQIRQRNGIGPKTSWPNDAIRSTKGIWGTRGKFRVVAYMHLASEWFTPSHFNPRHISILMYLKRSDGAKSRHNHAGALPGASHMNARQIRQRNGIGPKTLWSNNAPAPPRLYKVLCVVCVVA